MIRQLLFLLTLSWAGLSTGNRANAFPATINLDILDAVDRSSGLPSAPVRYLTSIFNRASEAGVEPVSRHDTTATHLSDDLEEEDSTPAFISMFNIVILLGHTHLENPHYHPSNRPATEAPSPVDRRPLLRNVHYESPFRGHRLRYQ